MAQSKSKQKNSNQQASLVDKHRKEVKHLIYSDVVDLQEILSRREEAGCTRDCPYYKDATGCSSCGLLIGWYNHELIVWRGDEKSNLDIDLTNNIIALADVGTWHGTVKAAKVLGCNVNNIFDISEDRNEYYADAYNIRAICGHHDGTNRILYRLLKPDIEADRFMDILYDNQYNMTSTQLSRYTSSLLPYVKQVYGW